MLWILLFLFSVIVGEESSPTMAHFEGGLPCVAGGFVHVMSGAPVITETDLVIPGVEPLVFSRRCHYEPKPWNIHTTIKSWDINLIQALVKKFNVEYTTKNELGENVDVISELYHLKEDSQQTFLFKFEPKSTYLETYFSIDEHGKGVTNLGHGYPSGRVAAKNLSVRRNISGDEKRTKGRLKNGSGEKLDFWVKDTQTSYYDLPLSMPLREIVTPRGFKKNFSYQDKDGEYLESIVVETASGRVPSRFSFKHEWKRAGEQLTVTTPDRRSVVLDYASDHHKGAADRKLLRKVTRSDFPTVEYDYHPSDKNKQLTSVRYPEQRGVSFTYWEDGEESTDGKRTGKLSRDSHQICKIKSILQPVGRNAERIPTHFIQYFIDKKKEWKEGHTRVTTSYGHVDDYFFGDDFLLKEVRHFTNPHPSENFEVSPYQLQHACDQIEKIFWYDGGEIKTWALCDGEGTAYSVRHYTYDDNGNVLTENTFGSLTGDGCQSPGFKQNGDPIWGKSERVTKKFTYSDDGLNLLLSEENSEGLKVVYTYVEGSDRLRRRITFAKDETIKKEFFTYDEDNCLVSREEKGGAVHFIERYIVSKKTPFGYPLHKLISTIDEDGEHLYLSHHYRYNPRGNLVTEEIKDPSGNLLSAHYKYFDKHGNCVYEKDPLGFEIVRTVDANDNCIREDGPRLGLVKEFVYDYMNRCTEERVSYEGKTWSTFHTYNQLNQRIETEDPFGNLTRWVYDRYGRVVETQFPVDNIVVRKKFDAAGNEIETIDPMGYLTKRKFTIHNQPSEIVYPDGSIESFRYNKDGTVASSTEKNGLWIGYQRDPLGRDVAKTVDNATETYEYNHTLLVRFTNFNGVATTYTYDRLGRKTSETTDGATTTFEYDPLGRLFRTSCGGKTNVEIFDPKNQLVEKWTEDTQGNRYLYEKYSYDAVGNKVSELRGGHLTTYAYDGINRLTKRVNPEGHETQWFYSNKGHKETRVAPNGVSIEETYDAVGRLILKEQYNRKILLSSVTYKYDKNGNLIFESHWVVGREVEPYAIKREYDAMNRLVHLIEPLGKTTSYTYHPGGQLKTWIKPDGTVLTYEYYVKGDLAYLSSSDGSINEIYTYDLMGNLLSVGDVARTYTPRGMLKTDSYLGQTFTYDYDDLDRVVKMTLPDFSIVEYEYNPIGISKVKRKGYEHAYLDFDSFGNVTLEKLIDGTLRTKSYDSLGRLKTITHPVCSFGPFEYDLAGNLTQAGSKNYTYDKLNQLSSEAGPFNHTYAFDSVQNPCQKDQELFDVNDRNEVLSKGKSTYTYDKNGNLLTKVTPEGSWSYGYDPLDRLITVNDQYHYMYDSLHRRLRKKSPQGEERYWYAGENEIASISADATIVRVLGISLGGEIGAGVMMEVNGEVLVPHYDHCGNLVHLGQTACEYSAFGEQTTTLPVPWGFSSKHFDPETGFSYFGRRYYDPSLLRWTSTDPLSFSAGVNLYSYVFNNPLVLIDKRGLFAEGFMNLLGADPCVNTLCRTGGLFYPDVAPNQKITYDDNFELNYPDYAPSRIYQLPDRQPLPQDRMITFINGMNNTFNEFLGHVNYLSDHAMGGAIGGVYNSSHGIPADLKEVNMGLHFKATAPVRLLHQQWNDFFNQSSPDGRILQFCTSQGCIHVRNALLDYPDYLRQRIEVVAIAPAAYIHEKTCGKVTHYCTSSWRRDPIPRIDVLGAARERNNIIYLDSHSSAGEFDHSISSPTYKMPIKDHIDSHLNQW